MHGCDRVRIFASLGASRIIIPTERNAGSRSVGIDLPGINTSARHGRTAAARAVGIACTNRIPHEGTQLPACKTKP